MPPVKIRYDAADAQFLNIEPELEGLVKQNCLRWIDLKVQMQNNTSRKWGGSPADPTRYCYDQKNKIFPTGLVPRVLTLFLQMELDFELEDLGIYKPSTEYIFPDWGWAHQKQILDTCLENTRCVIRAPTASGKSKGIVILVDNFREHNILIVVPSLNLASNITEDLKSVLTEEVGRIGGGKENWQRK